MRRDGERAWPPAFSAIAFCAAVAFPASALAEDPLVIEVKAVDLYKFAPFVDWPAGALGPAHEPFSICIVGRDPFGALLDRVVAGQTIDDHPVVVRRMPTATPDPPCRIMFIGGSTAQSVRDALEVEQTAPVLTVTDDAASHGVVDFVIDQGRVRFRIDDRAAALHGLTIRAQLLNVAMSVIPRKAAR